MLPLPHVDQKTNLQFMAHFSSSRLRVIVIIIATFVGLGALYFASKPLLKRADLPSWPGVMVFDDPHKLESFSLVDHKGAVFDNDRFADHWTFMLFGYTHCPDFCPTTLNAMNKIYKSIGTSVTQASQTTPVQFVFVSVDPFRDTQEAMAEHIYFYNPEFIGVTASDNAALKQMTEQFGASFDYEDPATGDRIPDPSKLPPGSEYIVNHYGSLFLIGPDERVYADLLPPYQVERVREVFDTLVAAY